MEGIVHGDLETVRRSETFPGTGEMARLCRAYDWASTPLGDPADWSRSLCATVRIVLASRHPMFIWWGPDLIQIYNDAYRPSFAGGGRHPAALGAPGARFWTDIWHIIGPQIEAVMTRGESTWHEDHLVPIIRNGQIEQVYWTYGYSPLYDDDGSIGGTLVVCTETTQRVLETAEREALIEAERAARADAESARALMARIFAQAPVAIAVLEAPDLMFTVANAQYRAIIGGRDPVGQTLTGMFPELAGSDVERMMRRVIETGEPFTATDFLVHFDSQGTGRIDNYYDFLYHPMITDRDTVTGVAIVVLDVTERRLAAAERERLLGEAQLARSEAEHANRVKSEFLAAMSHEFRTPLNAISGYVDMIDLGVHGPVTPEQRDDLERIRISQRHLLGLINGLLSYARVEAGSIEFRIADVPLAGCLATCCALTQPQARTAQLTIRAAEPDADVTARADPEKLQQIVLNLLTNAIKFTAPGGAIELSAAVGGHTVRIEVADTGRGIPRDHLAVIFDPFVQLDTGGEARSDGVGLGLAISRNLARAMGGDLVVASTPGAGSRFTLTLPCAGSSRARDLETAAG